MHRLGWNVVTRIEDVDQGAALGLDDDRRATWLGRSHEISEEKRAWPRFLKVDQLLASRSEPLDLAEDVVRHGVA